MTWIGARHRAAAALIAALAPGMISGSAGAAGADRPVAITCTNPASGAAWQIVLDPKGATVDANPARFSPGEISWFEPKDGGHYRLDRKSGELVASVASSTGGYFRRARCDLKDAQ